jgi:hypothetical protein
MSLLDWYRHKADQCRRLAQRVRNPKERFKIQDEQREWLHIANKELSKDREETDIGCRRARHVPRRSHRKAILR